MEVLENGASLDSSFKISPVYCANPLKKPGHDQHRKNLRTVTQNILMHHKDLVDNDKLCDSCRKAVLRLPLVNLETEESCFSSETGDEVPSSSESFPISTPQREEALESFNEGLAAIDESPVKKKRLSEKNYPEAKFKKVTDALKTKILGLDSTERDSSTEQDNYQEIIRQLKQKFHSTTDKSVKMQVLTTLPQSWTLKKIEDEFGVSNFIARKVKQLVAEKGIMSSPDPKPRKTLSTETVSF